MNLKPTTLLSRRSFIGNDRILYLRTTLEMHPNLIAEVDFLSLISTNSITEKTSKFNLLSIENAALF